MKKQRPPDLIERLWPAQQEPHFIGGASGSGKTTFLFQMIKDWQAGREVLGCKSNPQPYVYVTLERTEDTTADTLRRVGIDPHTFPFRKESIELPAPRQIDPADFRAEKLIERTLKEFPGAKVLFIDGFGFLAPHGEINNYVVIGNFLQRITTVCEQREITIVGLVHVPKQRKDTAVKDPRQRILGSVAAAAVGGSIMMIDEPSPTQRIVNIYPRNSAPRKEQFVLNNDGIFVTDEVKSADDEFYIMQQIREMGPGATVTSEVLEALGAKINLSPRTTRRRIGELCDQGNLERVQKGVYRIPYKETVFAAPGAVPAAPPAIDSED